MTEISQPGLGLSVCVIYAREGALEERELNGHNGQTARSTATNNSPPLAPLATLTTATAL